MKRRPLSPSRARRSRRRKADGNFRTVADAHGWRLLRIQKLGPCRGCGVGGNEFGLSLHHLVSRSLGGDDVSDNLVPLCGSGSTGCHGQIETHPPGWKAVAARVRKSLTTAEIRYVVAKKGRDFLDRYYPKEARC